jgi:hypothetical protein
VGASACLSAAPAGTHVTLAARVVAQAPADISVDLHPKPALIRCPGARENGAGVNYRTRAN